MRPPKRIVILSSAEYQLLFYGLLHFRNKLIQQGRYTDAIDELLIKLQKARRKTEKKLYNIMNVKNHYFLLVLEDNENEFDQIRKGRKERIYA